jgi:hypothetical protein
MPAQRCSKPDRKREGVEGIRSYLVEADHGNKREADQPDDAHSLVTNSVESENPEQDQDPRDREY